MQLDIPTGEVGTTRVFSLSMPAVDALALRDSLAAQSAMLGTTEDLNPAGIEVFAVKDLGDLGLAGYLKEGVDAQDADLKRDAPKLAALDGWVMVVHALAYGGHAMTLTPDPALTLIGTYAQTPADRQQIDVHADAARPYSGRTQARGVRVHHNRRGGAWVVAVLTLLAALILWWAFAA